MRLPRTLARVMLAAVLIAPVTAAAQDLRESLFRDADAAMARAKEAHGDVLAPSAFADAEKLYRRAEENLKRGKNIEDIREDLVEAVRNYDRATKATALARVTFESEIQARQGALSAGAPEYAAESWSAAEAKFAEAASKLEDGDVKGARKRSGEAERMYRDVELQAIKVNYLDETRLLLARADAQKVEKLAPRTLSRARELLSEAETALERDRYDTDRPRSLARDAKYEAQHALHLARVASDVEKKRSTLEDLLLASEEPLVRIAGALDVTAEFDAGAEAPTAAILEEVARAEDEVSRLGGELALSEERAASLEAQVTELEQKLGGVSEETLAIKRRMEAEGEVRQKFARIEKAFSRDEARVLREGKEVILRLVGLNFASGAAVIEPQYFGLLTKVQDALRVFPQSAIRIEGHTDSHGTDSRNLELSNERAEAVRAYLLANMRMEADRVQATGFGESRPIANNETAEGRKRNRRIDVVIQPDLDGAEG